MQGCSGAAVSTGGRVRQGITVPLPCSPKHGICGKEMLLVGCKGSFAECEQPWGLGPYSRSFCSSWGVSGDELSIVHNRHQKPGISWEYDPTSRLTQQQQPSK